MARIRRRRDIIDRETLVAEIDEKLAELGTASRTQGEVLARLKDALNRGRVEVRRRFEDDAIPGGETVRALAYLVDELIAVIHHIAADKVYPISSSTKGEAICIIATGGYGRGTLAPFSDIDLLFLLPYKQTPHAEQRRRIHALRAVGPGPQGRPRLAHGRGVHPAGPRRLHHPHLDPGGPLAAAATRSWLTSCSAPLPQAGAGQGTGAGVRRRQAERARRAPRTRGRHALRGRAQRQGGQGRPARPQHALLDRQVPVPRRRRRPTWSQPGCSTAARTRALHPRRTTSCGRCAATCTT